MNANEPCGEHRGGASRRTFLERLGLGVAAGAVGAGVIGAASGAADAEPAVDHRVTGRVRHRKLGRTGLAVSEIGYGGHSWSYQRVPDGDGFRRVTIDEAVEMIAAGLDMGVNFFDSCTPELESTIPGEALKRLKRRDEAVICVRPSHKMKGVEADKEEVFQWTESRLRMWQTDCIDLLLLSNEVNVTPQSGYWDMTYCIEALEKLKQQGKIRFTGFGSHFEPKWFFVAFQKFAKDFDVCSMPYNVRHRLAETVLPAAKQAGLGVIAIKPFARGALLRDRDLEGADADLPRDLIAFVLENPSVDVCLAGFHTIEQMKLNFSASWTRLDPDARRRLEQFAATTTLPHGEHAWLEDGWRYA
jgi:aryl-alcohol dehydrogenase-like predicted oxidoreductase